MTDRRGGIRGCLPAYCNRGSEVSPLPLGLYTAARLDRVSVRGLPDGSVADHEGRGMVETWVTPDAPSMLSLRSSGFWIHFGYSFCRISLASGLTWAYLD